MSSEQQTHRATPSRDQGDKVWDASVRWFHWINVLCILFMVATGTMILYGGELGIKGEDKVPLKTVHSYGGYVFAVNLTWRLVWAFIGSKSAQWPALLPVGKGFIPALRQQIRDFGMRRITPVLGHSPLGRMMISFLLLLMLIQAITGLVLAGTDVYLPPFGGYIANWVTAGDPALLELLRPGSTEHVVESAWTAMREFRSPIRTVHETTFYVLLFAIVGHIAANVIAEVWEATGQISAMFSGRRPTNK